MQISRARVCVHALLSCVLCAPVTPRAYGEERQLQANAGRVRRVYMYVCVCVCVCMCSPSCMYMYLCVCTHRATLCFSRLSTCAPVTQERCRAQRAWCWACVPRHSSRDSRHSRHNRQTHLSGYVVAYRLYHLCTKQAHQPCCTAHSVMTL